MENRELEKAIAKVADISERCTMKILEDRARRDKRDKKYMTKTSRFIHWLNLRQEQMTVVQYKKILPLLGMPMRSGKSWLLERLYIFDNEDNKPTIMQQVRDLVEQFDPGADADDYLYGRKSFVELINDNMDA
jgi:hypothetical protein